MSLSIIDWWALAFVVFIGLPHGAFDAAISLSLLPSSKKTLRYIMVLIAYLLIAIGVVFIWHKFPSFSLTLFLVISLVHFGMADYSANPTRFKWVHIIAHGGIVTLWLPVIHKESVAEIFLILTSNATPFLWNALSVLTLLWLVACVIHMSQIWRIKHQQTIALELVGLIIIAWFIPPLATFALYFCFIHSRRHFVFIWQELQSVTTAYMLIISATLLSLASWVMGAGLFWYLYQQMAANEAALQTIFIGLAALTVPHMILIDFIFRPHSKKLIKNRHILNG